MKKQLIMGLVVIMAIFAFAVTGIVQAADTPAKADKKEGINQSDEKPAKISEEAQAVADLSMAGKLAQYGRQTGNPLALLVSAQMIKNISAKEEKRTKTTEGEKSEGAKDEKKGAVPTPENLLAEAKKMAQEKDMDAIAAMIDKESKIVAQRGASGGPVQHVDSVLARSSDIFNISFRGGELARVALVEDGDCDLDLYVYDENGNLIESDTDRSDECYVEWVPRWTGSFRVKVKNLGRVYADYILLTN